MGLIPESTIEEVLDRADIVDTVRRYIALEKSGKSYRGLCPFHDDHDPSLKVHPGKQIYKCFACGAGGNSIGFVMEMEGWNFPEAIRQLADRYGVDVPDQDPEAAERARKRRNRKNRYFAVMKAAGEFYRSNLWSDEGRAAQMYLEERDIDEETAREFGLGYAPDGWEQLLGHLSEQGFDGEQAEAAGLALERNSSPGHYDRFRHRIVFPVIDIWRNIRAFGGRTLAADDDTPKYMNSPETPFYTKGEHLYGLHAAKKHFQEDDFALLVEGNFDVLALHAAGIRTAIAPMGTSLTTEQAELLSRYTRTVVVAFDGDDAGADATRRCLPALQDVGLEGRVIRFDERDDPDTFVRREGASALRDKTLDAEPIVGWAIDAVLASDGAPVEEKVSSIERAAKILDDVSNESVRREHIKYISQRLDIETLESKPEEVINKFLEQPVGSRDAAELLTTSAEKFELPSAESSLLSVLLEHPEWIEHFLDGGYEIMLANERLAGFLENAFDHFERHDDLKLNILLEKVDGARMRQTIIDAVDDEGLGVGESQHLAFYQDCVRRIQQKYAERGIRRIERQMDDLNFREDRDKFEELNGELRKFQQLKHRSVSSPAGSL